MKPTNDSTMLARLGHVLYWTACAIAGAFIVLAAALIRESGFTEQSLTGAAIIGAIVAAVYAIGRAVRWILANE